MPAAPPVLVEERGRPTVFLWLGGLAGLGGAVLLYWFNPVESSFYPRCFFKMATGFDCPGCGGLRATHQLLHGHWQTALGLNPLFVLALPLAACLMIRAGWEKKTGRRGPRLFRITTVVWIAAALVIGFGVLRNAPWRSWLGTTGQKKSAAYYAAPFSKRQGANPEPLNQVRPPIHPSNRTLTS